MNENNEQTIKEEVPNMEWLNEEIKELEETQKEFTGERLPYMKFEEKKIADVEIDITKPFTEWIDTIKGTKKAIIELTHQDTKKVWFLNKRNPIYRTILKGIQAGNNKFKILQIGSQADTKYEVIE